jgi:hypothetical protein
MKSLIKHDLRWAWPLALLGTALHVFIQQNANHVAGVWILPSNDHLEVALSYCAVVASLLGVWAIFADDLLGVREYLVHRPVSAPAIFWARHLVGLAVVASWVLLTPTVHLAGTLLFSPNASLVDAGRWAALVGMGGSALFFYALAAFLASCTRSVIAGLLLAAAGASVLHPTIWLTVIDTPPAVFIVSAVVSAALAPLLLVLAERNRRLAADPDRPWSSSRLTRAGTGLLIVTGVAAALVLTFFQVVTRLALLDTYPRIAVQDGQPVLVAWSRRDRHYWRVDDQHRPVEPLTGAARLVFTAADDLRRLAPMPAGAAAPAFSRGSPQIAQLPSRVHRMGGRLYREVTISGRVYGLQRAFLDQDGYVRVYRLAMRDGVGEDQPRVWVLGRGPERTPLSAGTVLLDEWGRDGFFGVEGELWRLQLVGDAPNLVHTPLPGGDRFVETVGLFSRSARMLDAPPVIVRGQHGIYMWRDRHFVPADGLGPEALNGWEVAKVAAVQEVRLRGDTGMDVWIRGDSGPTFAHQYRPHTVPEHILAFLQRGSGALRSPLSTLAAPLAGPDRALRLGAALLLDRPALLGDWPALGANLLLTALLAALAFRRLGRFGAPRARRLYWAGAILLGGAPAYLAFRLIERRRGWAPMPDQPEGRPAATAAPLLLQNA